MNGAPHMHPLQFFGPLSILVALVRDYLNGFLMQYGCSWDFMVILPFPYCRAAWRRVGYTFEKHSYTSLIKSNVIMGEGLFLEFLESVPRNTSCRNSEDGGQGRRAAMSILHPCSRVLGSTRNRGFPTFPAHASELLLSQHISASLL